MSAEEVTVRGAPDPVLERQRGFSLVEVLVSLALLVVVMTAFLTLLDSSARVSKTQSSIAGMTENLRFTVEEMVRTVRMAGTGGVPLLAPGASGLNVLAVTVTDNSDSSQPLTFGTGPGSRTTLPGTDAMMVRGVIGGELYDVRGATALVDNGDTTYTVTIPATSPYTGQPQQLLVPEAGTPIIFTTTWELPVPLPSGVTRYFSKYNIGLITSASRGSNPTDPLVVDFKTTGANDNENAILALNEGGDFQPFQEEFVITAGFLDDLVFFIAANDSGEPSLFMFTPDDNTVSELVPNVANLQVALGCDLNGDGVLTEDGTNGDEWFFNAAGDTAPTAAQMAMLQEVRVSVVARGESREDMRTEGFVMPENAPALAGEAMNFRHRSISVHVTVRSHPPVVQG